MKITSEMSINDLLEIDEERMLKTLTWLAPELERLQRPSPMRGTFGTVTVAQVARIAKLQLEETLYILNLAAGESEEVLSDELRTTAYPNLGDQGEPTSHA